MRENMMRKLAKPMLFAAAFIWGSSFFIMKDVQLLSGSCIQLGTKLGKGSQLTVLSQLGTNGRGNLFDCLDLRCAAYTGYRQTSINSRTETRVKHLRFQINLTVCNGNHVGRNISRHVSGLSLNNRQCSQGTASQIIGQPGSTL